MLPVHLIYTVFTNICLHLHNIVGPTHSYSYNSENGTSSQAYYCMIYLLTDLLLNIFTPTIRNDNHTEVLS